MQNAHTASYALAASAALLSSPLQSPALAEAKSPCDVARSAVEIVMGPIVDNVSQTYAIAALTFVVKKAEGGQECTGNAYLVPALPIDQQAGINMRKLAKRMGVDLEKMGMIFEELEPATPKQQANAGSQQRMKLGGPEPAAK